MPWLLLLSHGPLTRPPLRLGVCCCLTEVKRLEEEANFLAFEEMMREGLELRRQREAEAQAEGGEETREQVNAFTNEPIVPIQETDAAKVFREARCERYFNKDSSKDPTADLPLPPPRAPAASKESQSIFGDADVVDLMDGAAMAPALMPPTPPSASVAKSVKIAITEEDDQDDDGDLLSVYDKLDREVEKERAQLAMVRQQATQTRVQAIELEKQKEEQAQALRAEWGSKHAQQQKQQQGASTVSGGEVEGTDVDTLD